MAKRIFNAVFLVACSVLCVGFVIVLGVLYEHFTVVQKEQLEEQTMLAVHGVENEGKTYLTGLHLSDKYRLTWLDAEGNVCYDSEVDAATMENHAEREEIKEAYTTGTGESLRYSSTLTERTLYCAKLLTDGTVLRMSVTMNSVISLVIGMLQPIFVVILFAVILSAVLANRLAKRIVRPMNELNLEQPLENETYEELSPLLLRIERQHREIYKQMELLKSEREEWNTVTECMSEGILILNKNNEIISMNRSAMRLLELDKSSMNMELLVVNRNLSLQGLIEKAKLGEHAETVLELAGGEYQVTAGAVLSEGELRGVVLLMFDVSDKERAEQMRREFTANVSHELKTPLHSISGCAELIKDGIVEPEDIKRFSEQIYNESQRMMTLVEDIIRLSKLDEGIEESPREEIDILSLAEDTVKLLKPVADEKKITLSVSGEEKIIRGIRPLIKELIYNLCDNAIKYNRTAGSVDVNISEQENHILLTVTDTGIGIPREHLGRIFERFYRVDKSHSKEIGGTGLGLSIVKHIARLHDASLDVTSRLGEGSSFTVIFHKL